MKDRHIAGFLALFLGGLGIHKFYIGRTGQGFLYLLFCWTYIPLIFSIMDAIYYFSFKSNEEFTRKVCPTPQNGPSRGNKLEELKKLKELLDMKAISKAEFEIEKGKIIVSSQSIKVSEAPLRQKTVSKIEKKREVKYETGKPSFFQRNRKTLKQLLILLLVPFILLFLFTLSAVIYGLFKGGSSKIQETPEKYADGVVIKDPNHPSRSLCRKELEKRIKNHYTVNVSLQYEYVVYYPNEQVYTVGGFVTRDMKYLNNTSDKVRDQDYKCFSKAGSVCDLLWGLPYECSMKAENKEVIPSSIKLRFAPEEDFYNDYDSLK